MSVSHPLRVRDYFALNAYWFALSFLWNSMAPLLLPVLVLNVVGEAHKGSALGTLSALGLIIATIVQPASGAWTDARVTRWGKRRPYLVGGTLFDVVFLLAMFVAGDYFFLLIAYALLQIVSNIAHGPYQAYLTDLVPEAQRGKVSGVKLIFEMVGGIATALAVGNLIGQGQILAAFLAIIFFLLVTMAITARFVDEQPFDGAVTVEHPERSVAESKDAPPLQLLFHSRDFFLWLVSRLAILTAVNLIRNYLMFFLNDVLRIENAAAEVGNLLAILGISVAIIVYPAGALSDRWGRKPLIIFSGVLGAVGALAMMFATTMPLVFIAGTIIGIGIGIFLSVNWAWGADLIPANAGGRLLGISNIATAGAGVLAGAGGWMLDFFNAQSPNLGYAALYLTAALCYVVGTLIVIGVKDKPRRNNES
ncbi:MAG: MFS transporter [Anaerolineales bacterium]|nr:MFS transporter [Anaerolineales bacterium]